jgi:hypothetical protein
VGINNAVTPKQQTSQAALALPETCGNRMRRIRRLRRLSGGAGAEVGSGSEGTWVGGMGNMVFLVTRFSRERREAELPDVRVQAELGHEDYFLT